MPGATGCQTTVPQLQRPHCEAPLQTRAPFVSQEAWPRDADAPPVAVTVTVAVAVAVPPVLDEVTVAVAMAGLLDDVPLAVGVYEEEVKLAMAPFASGTPLLIEP